VSFQADAAQRFAPSMQQRISLDRPYHMARAQVQAASYDGQEPLPSPETCPFSLDQLLNGDRQTLEAVLARASSA
jgi:hypothetical protein